MTKEAIINELKEFYDQYTGLVRSDILSAEDSDEIDSLIGEWAVSILPEIVHEFQASEDGEMFSDANEWMASENGVDWWYSEWLHRDDLDKETLQTCLDRFKLTVQLWMNRHTYGGNISNSIIDSAM